MVESKDCIWEERVVFRRVEDYTSGLVVPKVFLEKQLPDAMVHKFNNFCRELARSLKFTRIKNGPQENQRPIATCCINPKSHPACNTPPDNRVAD